MLVTCLMSSTYCLLVHNTFLLPAASGAETEPVLVDPPTSRREALEPEQLPDGHDPGPRGRGGDPGAHPVSRDLLSHLGGSVLGEGFWI